MKKDQRMHARFITEHQCNLFMQGRGVDTHSPEHHSLTQVAYHTALP
jgi:hypothetical protein